MTFGSSREDGRDYITGPQRTKKSGETMVGIGGDGLYITGFDGARDES